MDSAHGCRHGLGSRDLPHYQGERATLDGRGCEFVLYVRGAYSWFWGLEIMDSNPTRFINQPGEIAPDAFGVAASVPGVRL